MSCIISTRLHTVADNAFPAVLHAAEEGGPAHEVVQVEADVIVFGEGIEVSEVEGEKVRRGHATDGGHDDGGGIELVERECSGGGAEML